MSEESKYPIILPQDNKFTDLVVLDCHEKVHHFKVKGTLSEFRSRFWVTRGRQYVKKVINNCFVCRKLEGKPYNSPPIAPLPDFRVTEAPPFSKVGIDFAGPLFVKQPNGDMKKAYVALFTCCVTRAVHIELVENLYTDTFINCLRRFSSRRGTPTLLVSDNAKTFIATVKILKKLSKDKNVESYLTGKRIQWKFNLERSAWMGGFFERMIGSMKRCLRKVLGNAKLSSDELSTVLSEVECTLNARPLTYQYNDLEEVLTPSHLIFGYRLSPLSQDINLTDDNDNNDNHDKVCKRFLYLSKKLSHFWNRWRREYVTDLREFHKLKQTSSINIAKGDMVLIQEENVKRVLWKTGIVKELIYGKDGQVRGAQIRKAGGKYETLNRPLQKLFPLEISSRDNDRKEGNVGGLEEKEEMRMVSNDDNEIGDKIRLEGLDGGNKRRPRAAAKDARWKSRLMLDPQVI